MQPKTRAELKQQGYVIGKEAASILGIHHDRKTLSRYVVRFHIKAQLPLSKDGTLSNVWMYHKEDCEKARKKIDAEKEAKAIANCPNCYFYRELSGFGYACHYAIETELPKVYHGAECYQKEGTHYIHKKAKKNKHQEYLEKEINLAIARREKKVGEGMGYSSSKEYLRQYEKAVFRVQARTDQLVEMRVKSVSLSASSAGVRVQRSHSGDERARLIEKIVETERRLDEDIAREILVRDEITAAILEVPDPAEAQVLLYRYIHLLKWKEIASRLHYTLRWVYILHGKGLQKIKVP